jgi:hypothetical protein
MKNRIMRGLPVAVAGVLLLAGPAAAGPIVLSRDINTYVLFAYDFLSFKGGNDGAGLTGFIYGGNVGVNAIDPHPGNDNDVVMNVGANARFIMSDGAQLVADTSRFGTGASVDAFFSNCAEPGYNCAGQTGTIRAGVDGLTVAQAFTFATSTEAIIAAADLPTLPFTPGRPATVNSSDDRSYSGSGNTLGPGTYGDINVQNGATLTLGAGTYNLAKFTTGQHVTIVVSPDTVLMIDGRFSIGDDSTFGSANAVPWVYAGSYGVGANDDSIHFGQSVDAYGHFFAPFGNMGNGSNGVNLYGTLWGKTFSNDFNTNIYYIPPTVPDPGSSLLLLGMGLAGLMAGLRNRRQ